MFTRLLNALAILTVLASGASAQDWAKQMFGDLEFDFGVVARGAKAEHRFTVQNVYLEDAHIQSVSSSCGCTTPTVTKDLIKTWEKSEVVATINTRSFMGPKEAAVTVRFDRPFPAEVILRVRCFIRGDVVVQPGAIEFGSVDQGSPSERRAVVQYAGRDDWRVMAVEKSNKFVDVRMTESNRSPGLVSYDLVVGLKPDTPPGYIHEQLVLVTNDSNPRTSRVPITVEGVVVPGLTVRPSPLLLGVVNAGQTVTRSLVVQGRAPFKIAGVECSDSRFRFQVPTAAQTLQIVPVTFAAGSSAGNVDQTVHINTVGGAGLDVAIHVEVVAPSKPLDQDTLSWPDETKKFNSPAGRSKSEKSVPMPGPASDAKTPPPSTLTPVPAPALEQTPSTGTRPKSPSDSGRSGTDRSSEPESSSKTPDAGSGEASKPGKPSRGPVEL